MNKLITILTILSIVSCSSLQSKNSLNTDKKIKNAYNFLVDKNLIDNNIIVADTIVNINLSDFTLVLFNQESDFRKRKLHDSLSDISSKYDNYYYATSEIVKNKNTKIKNTEKIYFSEPTEDYVMVEIFDLNQNSGNTRYEVNMYFGVSKKYLIYFKGDKVDKYYFIPWRYN